MDDPRLIIDLHKHNARLGPGSDAMTRRALELSGLLERRGLEVADLGCGTGASTMVLAEALDTEITAVDLFAEFLQELTRRAEARGVASRITPVNASFDALTFGAESLDVVWSEGAIYNLGFRAGVEAWSRYLKPGGVLAVSELTWLTAERPAELNDHWQEAYPEVDTASAKLGILEAHGLTPVGYFPLPQSCWLEHYYRPLQARFATLLEEHEHSEEARALVAAEEREIDLYERYREYVSYGFYVARRL